MQDSYWRKNIKGLRDVREYLNTLLTVPGLEALRDLFVGPLKFILEGAHCGPPFFRISLLPKICRGQSKDRTPDRF
jgi:hypothetical protein